MTMKSTANKLSKWKHSKASLAADAELIARRATTEYHNTAVQAYNAEMYAQNAKIEYLMEVIANLSEGLLDAHREINTLKTQILKTVRVQGATPQIEYISETVTTTTERVIVHGDSDLQKQYRKGVNINWNCGVPPVDIAFNEFDLYRRERNIPSMFDPSEVKQNWSTLFAQCNRLTGMPLSRLMKTYAQARKINY